MKYQNFNNRSKNTTKDKFINIAQRGVLKQISKEMKIPVSKLKNIAEGKESGTLNFYNKLSKLKIIQKEEKYTEIRPDYENAVKYMKKEKQENYLVVFKYRTAKNKYEYSSKHVNKKMLKYFDESELIEMFEDENSFNKNKYGNRKLLGFSVKTGKKEYVKKAIQNKSIKKTKRNK